MNENHTTGPEAGKEDRTMNNQKRRHGRATSHSTTRSANTCAV